jgi:hypothetical protein
VNKILLLSIVVVGSLFLWNIAKPDTVKQISSGITTKKTETVSITPQKTQKEYLFVPYWSFTKNITTSSEYSLIYFGVGVSTNGLNMIDSGYTNMNNFLTNTPNANERILAIRMVDKTINAEIIKNISSLVSTPIVCIGQVQSICPSKQDFINNQVGVIYCTPDHISEKFWKNISGWNHF